MALCCVGGLRRTYHELCAAVKRCSAARRTCGTPHMPVKDISKPANLEEKVLIYFRDFLPHDIRARYLYVNACSKHCASVRPDLKSD